MKTESSLRAGLFPTFAGVIFVTMTVAFLAIPYTLGGHPGEAAQQRAAATTRHLS